MYQQLTVSNIEFILAFSSLYEITTSLTEFFIINNKPKFIKFCSFRFTVILTSFSEFVITENIFQNSQDLSEKMEFR